MELYNRGSEWRRWDLHIHTPDTQKNDQYEGTTSEEKWNKYYEDIAKYVGDGSDPQKSIAVMGITDYMSLDNYKKIVRDNRLPKSIKLLIPNVEMRISPIAKNSPINIHCLFNPAMINQLESRFFAKLKFHYNDRDFSATHYDLISLGREYMGDNTLDENVAYRKGIEQYVLSPDTIIKLFEADHQLRKETIIVISNSDNDGVSGLKTHSDYFLEEGSQLDATRTQLYRLADMIFSPKNADVLYFLGKKADSPEEIIRRIRSLKPCIHGSDAHTNAKIFEPAQKRYCWIKADPTFNGLRQLLYEPEQRVRISQTKPETKADYQVIEHVEITDADFNTEPILFSDKLTCIIGGKSTGKSLLLNNIARTIDLKQVEEKLQITGSSGRLLREMTVYWADGSVVSTSKPDTKHKIVYIPQTYLNRLSDENEELTEIDRIIHDILMINPELRIAYQQMEKELSDYKLQLDGRVFVLLQEYKDLSNLESEITNIGTVEGITKEIEKLKKQKEELSSGSTLTEKELKQFDEAQSELTRIDADSKTTNTDVDFFTETESVVQLISTPRTISDEARELFVAASNSILEYANSEWLKKKEEILKYFNDKNEKIEERKRINLSVVSQIEPKIADNSAIKELTNAIGREEKKLFLINEKNEQLQRLQLEYNKMVSEVSDALNRFISIHQKFADIINESKNLSTDGLVFSSLVQFRGEAFLTKLADIYDRRQLKSHKEIISLDEKISIEDISNSLTESLIRFAVEGEVKLTKGRSAESALRELLCDWFNTAYQVQMDNDGIEEMSPGKKALVLLKMLINLAESECPILIDQPEDDLDNRSIFDELIPFISKKKLTRQIIIVTHNANVVLGGDAEEVIVANQQGMNARNKLFRFEYRSGSIENDQAIPGEESFVLGSCGIQDHICDVLEGGKTAFDLRMHKYRM